MLQTVEKLDARRDSHRSQSALAEIKSKLRDPKTAAIASIILEHVTVPIRRALVVGCGSGVEAAVLASELQAKVVGIDLDGSFDDVAAGRVDLRRGDATSLDFDDGEFDFVFSYHVLEHIPEYGKALTEMARVLSPGGTYCVGTPNRLRLIGYLGGKGATWREKIAWNVADWNAQLHGRFRNEFGAHAGFSADELKAALKQAFARADDITLPYYLRLYRDRARAVSLLEKSGLGRLLFPSVYFMGRK